MNYQVGDLVVIRTNGGKLAIVESVGTWSCDVRIIESNRKPRYSKEHLAKLGDS